ncbi:MAG TPA: hypothetical protein VES42_28945 [Pilimelia sp.]|nr:hypothetical protein [Pilimelia sp.]
MTPVTARPAAADPPAAPPPPEHADPVPSPPATRTNAAGRAATLARSGWVPAALLVAATAVCLRAYGVGARDAGAFAVYLTLGLTVPGLLVWRALRGGARDLATDLAGGLVVGYAVELACYLPARAAGAPLLVLIWPAGTLVAFAAVPRLRRHWRGGGRAHRPPAPQPWALAALFGFVVLYSAATFFRTHGLRYPSAGSPYLDIPFQLALAGELKHHFPPTIPFAAGEPLQYHWFVHAHLGASSWLTGIEPQILITRLAVLPMIAAIIVLLAAAARRITGRWWPGPAAVAILFFATITSPYGWTSAPTLDGNMLGVLWLSPTQMFGTTIFAGVLLVLFDLLGGEAPRRQWVLLALLIAALAGAKATFLPMLCAGLALTVALHALLGRRLHRPALGALGVAVGGLGLAQVVLFSGGAQGTVVAPLATMKRTVLAEGTGLLGPATVRNDWPLLLVLAGLSLAAILPGLAGQVGMLRSRETRLDPAMLTCLGIGAAGVGATLLLGHPGLGQIYFLQSARPALAIAAACGFAFLAAAGTRQAARWWAAGAVAVGAGIAGAVRVLDGDTLPGRRAGASTDALVWELVWPYAALAGCVAVCAAVLSVALRRGPARGATVGLLVAAVVTGMALPSSYDRLLATYNAADQTGWRDVTIKGLRQIPSGGIEAARWLRDNSAPDDLVATNIHCRPGGRTCDNRHFWISGYTERRVLLEGWGYTEEAMARSALYVRQPSDVPYWDPALLAANDAAFRTPTAATVTRLREEYKVRWLFVDPIAPSSPLLADFATLRYSAGKTAVYELTPS